jgi:hypothetical protein
MSAAATKRPQNMITPVVNPGLYSLHCIRSPDDGDSAIRRMTFHNSVAAAGLNSNQEYIYARLLLMRRM